MGNGETNRPEPTPTTKIDPRIELEQLFISLINSLLKKEGGNVFNAKALLKDESDELFKKEDSICLINFETDSRGITENNGLGNGFFCKLNYSYIPFKTVLFTNNHILNERSIQTGKKIKIKYQQKDIIIEISEKRNAFTNEKLDYTCVEIFEEDGITNFFEIDSDVLEKKTNLLVNQEIFIVNYNINSKIGLTSGKILMIKDDKMLHSAVTEEGSSGSALIRRHRNPLNLVVGIHVGTLGQNKYCNVALPFDFILRDLKLKIIESSKIKIIAKIKIPEDNYETRIINSFEQHERDKELKIDYSNVVKNEEEIKNCMIFIEKEKIDFKYKNKFEKRGEYEIIYIFHNLLNSTNFMFYGCNDLYELDLTNFNTQNVVNMSYMFFGCKNLKKLKLKDINTEKVTNMRLMFNECESLTDLDLSSFNTKEVQDMRNMFNRCNSLVRLNISSFNTEKVTTLKGMFWGCKSLEELDLSNFNTGNVVDMQQMFFRCHSLKRLDVRNFNTEKVTNMLEMFHDCHSLESLDLKSFFLTNCENTLGMFSDCTKLEKLDISNFDIRSIKDVSWLFSGCPNLKKGGVIAKDKKILDYFK